MAENTRVEGKASRIGRLANARVLFLQGPQQHQGNVAGKSLNDKAGIVKLLTCYGTTSF